MFGRKRIKELEKEVRELSGNVRDERSGRVRAEKGQAEAEKWAEQLKKDAEAIAKERDELKKMVREQTENDLAVAALKTLNIIPGGKPEPSQLERLTFQYQRVAMMNAQTSLSPLSIGLLGAYNRAQSSSSGLLL